MMLQRGYFMNYTRQMTNCAIPGTKILSDLGPSLHRKIIMNGRKAT